MNLYLACGLCGLWNEIPLGAPVIGSMIVICFWRIVSLFKKKKV